MAAAAPAPVALVAPPRRRRSSSRSGLPSKAEVEAALEAARKSAATARRRAVDAKAEVEQMIGEARRSDLIWAAGESAAAMTGTVAASVVYGVADYYVSDDYDSWIAGGLVASSLVIGLAALGAGVAIHPRIGTVGLAWATGWGAPGLSELVRRGVAMGLDATMTQAA